MPPQLPLLLALLAPGETPAAELRAVVARAMEAQGVRADDPVPAAHYLRRGHTLEEGVPGTWRTLDDLKVQLDGRVRLRVRLARGEKLSGILIEEGFDGKEGWRLIEGFVATLGREEQESWSQRVHS